MKRHLLVSVSAFLGASATRLDARKAAQVGGTCYTPLKEVVAILALIPGLAACGPGKAYHPIETAHKVEAAQPPWPRLVLAPAGNGAPGYSVQVPPWLFRRGVDERGSDRAEFEGEGIRLKFEYGPDPQIPSCGQRPCAQIETIDGRRATFIEVDLGSDRPTLFRRRAWALVEAGGAKLATDALCADALACERARQIVRTVRFSNYAIASPAPPIPTDEPSWPYLRGPSTDEAYCRRADPKDARRFRHLQLMTAFRDVRVYGRPGHMMCTTVSSKVGQCKITGWSEVRIETATDVSGFWNNGNVPVLLTFRGERSSCRRLLARD